MAVTAKREIRELYYITHVDNIASIIANGILSHTLIQQKGIRFTPIYDAQIVASRQQRKTPSGSSLWEYANLYFQPRNPMMYRVALEKSTKSLAVVGVKRGVLSLPDIFVTDGNAASRETNFYPLGTTRNMLPLIVRETDKQWWNTLDGSKRRIMAECLVPKLVPPDYIEELIVSDHEVAERVRERVGSDFDVVSHSEIFFEPERRTDVTENMSVIEGDMFFSRMQTLTVSVNVVGVMGKGLASRAKYQFPDAYVKYQDVCRSKALTMGSPYLYKRESSLDYELADDPSSIQNEVDQTWLLFFATKKHWRYKADINAIEKGLKWIIDQYRSYGIKSLAIPALGCGLGGLNWRDVGPLMCKYLAQLEIPVQIYLPAEKHVPDAQIAKDFLFPNKK